MLQNNVFFEAMFATRWLHAPKRFPDAFQVALALILEGVGAPLAALGRVLGPPGCLPGSPEASLGRSWAPLGCLVALLERIYALLDVSELNF